VKPLVGLTRLFNIHNDVKASTCSVCGVLTWELGLTMRVVPTQLESTREALRPVDSSALYLVNKPLLAAGISADNVRG